MTRRKPNGASSIYLGSDGTWHGRVTVGFKDDGSPDRRHVRGSSEAVVTKKVRMLERQRDAGTVARAGDRWTVAAWLEHWLETSRVLMFGPAATRPIARLCAGN
jgi:integrase